jgi:glutamate-1-semialdehyde 2,1-aminomutase
MQLVAPAGPMYQAGTLSGNPLAMTAGIETLKEIQKPSAWQQLELRSAQMEDGLRSAAEETSVAIQFNRVGTMFTTFFTDQPVTNWDGEDAIRRNSASFSTRCGARRVSGAVTV